MKRIKQEDYTSCSYSFYIGGSVCPTKHDIFLNIERLFWMILQCSIHNSWTFFYKYDSLNNETPVVTTHSWYFQNQECFLISLISEDIIPIQFYYIKTYGNILSIFWENICLFQTLFKYRPNAFVFQLRAPFYVKP